MSGSIDQTIVEQIIKDAIGWALTKNKTRLFEIMVHDGNFFIFHPDSKNTITGFEAFRDLAERAWMSDAPQHAPAWGTMTQALANASALEEKKAALAAYDMEQSLRIEVRR